MNIKNYPKQWEDFEPIQRQKAITIANSMLAQGYTEKDVIPIATKQAKQWYRMLTKEQLDAYEHTDIMQRDYVISFNMG
ncbi:DUF2188 domain-containing protein [Staphylococcus simiae]|uniref:DUF2188 domain-containing protein n=1 Tax=Staphylococcus simiae CCM 7213 = CCUG 51256 TaxID=911238 RepID=G5JI05_9STAP|nr:hypothetical protein [Staphylococcus simiae]EHJ08198.1 hypothetical protein SS7213T_05436 [Staphylococcus simiae CCM 7213 = CCUG 51256]PNZ14271.1 hypothetical protein CD113_02180 [Staphylococcus simiae]SNV81858.1 Uncharacterized protein conserved in bacteria [Staphylococcus simiae]